MIEEKIVKLVDTDNYLKGEKYNQNYVNLKKIIYLNKKNRIYKFDVESESTDKIYNVDITTQEDNVILTYCSCPQFEKMNKCKHVAAVLIKEQNKIFEISNKVKKDLSDVILNNILNKINKNKQQLNLELELNFKKSYYESGLYVKFKIGINKLYSATSKAKYFFERFNENCGYYEFGKDFEYKPGEQYFCDEDKKIISFLSNCYYRYVNERYYQGEIYIQNNLEEEFIKLLKNKNYSIMGMGNFTGYKDEFPFETEITNVLDKYIFKFNFDKQYNFLSKKLLIVDHNVYLLKDEYTAIINEFAQNDLIELDFSKDKLSLFSETILPIVKDNLKIDETIKDDFTITTPNVKLYFDIENELLTCNVILLYKDTEINYFDKVNIIRNREYEQNIINDLTSKNFKIDNKIFIDSLDEIAQFIETDLFYFSNKYEVFTTKKFDETNIIKKSRIESQFSIGQDNIMSYNFNIEDINLNELGNIFLNLNEKKKYYKLKNGNILNLENNNELNELQNLMEDLDLNINNIKDTGTIPKYRAIYLDSLKENKYSIIKTNNLFDNFVNDFKKFKNKKPYINEIDKQILRDYQITGVKWLYNIYKCNLGGILADEMGLGKSLQTICFIKSILKEKKDAKILIVSPTSLIYNWEKEFDKFASNLNYMVIAENKNKRMEILQNLESNIIITTYGLLRRDKEFYEKLNFEVMIIDEAQNIKNPKAGITTSSKEIKANCKIALTGTPVENSAVELWSIFDFIMPGFFTNLMKFQSKYNVKDFSDEKMDILNKLNLQISPFILRRKKVDVAKDLPEKIENNIYFDMYPEQKKIYLAQLKKTKEEMDEIISTEGFLKARFKILQLLTKLRQICIDPSIIFSDYKGGSVKIDELINLVKKIISNNHKILLFTSFKTALNIVKEKFDENDITSYTIDGSVSSKKRMELVEKFNSDNTNVFLIMLKAGGTGLNLTSADVVIHLDLWWNPQVENQATDRAHRIGQTKNVEVIKLICNGTIEERIIELQNKKKLLSDSLIEGNNRDKNNIEKLSEKDIKNLLNYEE